MRVVMMSIGDLIAELQKFPDLSSVFLQTGDGKIVRIDSVHNLWVKYEGSPESCYGPIAETHGDDDEGSFDADDFGALLYG